MASVLIFPMNFFKHYIAGKYMQMVKIVIQLVMWFKITKVVFLAKL